MHTETDDIDYRNLLAASSEEDLVLFEKELWTSDTDHIKIKSSSGAVEPSKISIGNIFAWSGNLKSKVSAVFQNRRQTITSDGHGGGNGGGSTGGGRGSVISRTQSSECLDNDLDDLLPQEAKHASSTRATDDSNYSQQQHTWSQLIGGARSSQQPRARGGGEGEGGTENDIVSTDGHASHSSVNIDNDKAVFDSNPWEDYPRTPGPAEGVKSQHQSQRSWGQSLLFSMSRRRFGASSQNNSTSPQNPIRQNSSSHSQTQLKLSNPAQSSSSTGNHRGQPNECMLFDNNVEEEEKEEEEEEDDMSGRYSYQSSGEEAEPLFGGVNKVSVEIRQAEKLKRRRILAGLGVFVILAAAIGAGVAIGIIYNRESDAAPIRDGYIYQDAAVAADNPVCSEIGRDTLLRGGTAIDAAIAALLCVGLHNAHSAGLGGGSFTTFYHRETQSAYFMDSREVAPLAASQDMFVNKSSDISTTGGLAIAVPGEVKGYWEAHQQFGKLEWASLFEPSIELAVEGFVITPPLSRAIKSNEGRILDDASLSSIFTDGNGKILQEGDTMFRPQLAETFKTLAENGSDAFYTGPMAEDIVQEIQDRGGIITLEDLEMYRVSNKTPLSIGIDGLTAFTGPPPCSGPVFALIMNILDGYDFSPDSIGSTDAQILTYHRIVESFKFAYAKRSALGDEDYVDVAELVKNMTSQDFADGLREKITDDRTHGVDYYDPEFDFVPDGGTAHISIVDQFGNAASITSTINTYFGSKVRGPTTGIIYNNEMDDFSTPGTVNSYGVPASPANFIQPGKRPLSSMTPVVFVNEDGDVRFVVGASGGTRITTGTSMVAMETLWFGSSLEEGIERRRLHHQLVPNTTLYEEGFPQAILDGLDEKGHDTVQSSSISVIQAVNRLEDGWLEAYCDSRKGGQPSGF